jgi:hypothetical protein
VIERCYQDDDGTESEDKADRERIRWMTKFFVNCGDVFNARGRKMMKRDTFTALMAKLVRDTYTFDANPIETEEGIDGPSKGKPVGLYAHDGSTFRNCAIQDDEVSGDENENSEYPPIAAQVIHQQVVQTFTPAQLIFDPRNPRSDIRMCGYGYSEAEMAIRIVTGWLNSYNTNARGQDENRIAPGVLTLIGDYGKSQVDDFRRQWTLLGRGIAPRWGLPVMSSKTKDGGVVWTPLGPQFNEQMFKAWMTFLTALICGLIGMDPQEVNFESFVVGKSSLSGSDTAERLASSKDKGLEPLLGYYQGLWSDYVVPCHFEDFRFRFTGLHPELLETRKATIEKAGTVNEYRAIEGLPPIPKKSGWGDLPINPALAQYVAPTIESLQPPQPAPMTPDQGAAAAGMSPEDAQRMMAHNQGTPGGPPGPAHPPQPGQPGQDKGAAMQAARGGAAARPGATAEQPRQVVRKALMFDVEVIQ